MKVEFAISHVVSFTKPVPINMVNVSFIIYMLLEINFRFFFHRTTVDCAERDCTTPGCRCIANIHSVLCGVCR